LGGQTRSSSHLQSWGWLITLRESVGYDDNVEDEVNGDEGHGDVDGLAESLEGIPRQGGPAGPA
jgi:hypothetical protein